MVIMGISKEEGKQKVVKLVDRFKNNIDEYKKSTYNETQVRREFIDPFFEALGWDVANKRGHAEQYKEVIHEFSQKTKDVVEAPDYLFRLMTANKFFVEAKKPSVNIKSDINPAFQLRRYAWSGKLPLSILTDFEEFSVYDCRIRPHKNDKASVGRIMYFTYEEYAERWDEIYSLFARDEIPKGAFDRYAVSNKNKKGTSEVDDEFLKEIEDWRNSLAKNIALRNEKLSNRELNFAVQKTIDRLIFLRICEDRGIEDYGQLMNLMNGANIYARLKQIYTRADEKYNSGLFYFDEEKNRGGYPDTLTFNLSIDDKVLKDIIKHLYYPESPYEFSMISADILGHVYEQFLGKVIRLTAGHRAVIEEKPEVKKAGGVYYTPTYIVDYIVKNTLGEKLDEIKKDFKEGDSGSLKKALKLAEEIKVLDPACGSGSFLLGAYQYLLDWHIEIYATFDIEKLLTKRDSPVYESGNGGLKLTTAERKRILLNNIYGVDIDNQAVEVTKLSLMLKVLEGETNETLAAQFSMFKQRALPDLSSNIKSGNSLIGPDFYEQLDLNFLDDEERYRINVFDWNEEFKSIMSGGGFSVVIGNPPYVRQELISEYKNYFSEYYKVFHGSADLYSYFIEKAISLMNESGSFSYIVANKWMRANYGKPLRDWLQSVGVDEIIDFGDLPVFKGATTYPCIIKINKGIKNPQTKVLTIENLSFNDLHNFVQENSFEAELNNPAIEGWSLIPKAQSDLIEKLFSKGVPLEEYVDGKIYYGIKTGLMEAFVIDEEMYNQLIKEDASYNNILKPFLFGKDIKRYEMPKPSHYLIFFPKGWTNKQSISKGFTTLNKMYPTIAEYLKQYEKKAMHRSDQGDYWWELRACDYYDILNSTKIIYPEISTFGQFTIDSKGFYGETTIFIIGSNSKELLALLNSKLITFLFNNISSSIRGGYLRWKKQYMKGLPICLSDEKLNVQLNNYVDRIYELKKKLKANTIGLDNENIERELLYLDNQIDKLVYELYGLTEEEIKIVEGK